MSPTIPAKRPRGRPSKASLAAAAAISRASVSSATTSNESESVSGYSTPFTSNTATPAESSRQSKIEVVIPVVKTRDSAAKAMQKAKDYMLGKDAKKARGFTEIADSEDDELFNTSPITSRTRNDEHVARQLQEDLDREAAEAYISESDHEEALEQDEMVEDSEDLPLANSKGKGKSVAPRPRPRPRGRAAAKSMVLDSDDDEEDYSDSGDFEPPSKKRKTAVSKGKTTSMAKGKGKARMPPPPSLGSDDDVEDDDIPGK